MAIALDLILAGVFIFILVRSYFRGFMRTVIELVGYILICVLAFTCSQPLAAGIYDTFVEESVVQSVESVVDTQLGMSAAEAADSLWERLPDFLAQSAAGLGITQEGLASALQQGLDHSEDMAGAVAGYVAEPIITGFIQVILILVILLLGMIIVRLIARAVNRIFQLPVLGTVNRVLGGILGLFKACLLTLLLCWLISLLASMAGGDFGFQLRGAIDRTFIFKWVSGLLPG